MGGGGIRSPITTSQSMRRDGLDEPRYIPSCTCLAFLRLPVNSEPGTYKHGVREDVRDPLPLECELDGHPGGVGRVLCQRERLRRHSRVEQWNGSNRLCSSVVQAPVLQPGFSRLCCVNFCVSRARGNGFINDAAIYEMLQQYIIWCIAARRGPLYRRILKILICSMFSVFFLFILKKRQWIACLLVFMAQWVRHLTATKISVVWSQLLTTFFSSFSCVLYLLSKNESSETEWGSKVEKEKGKRKREAGERERERERKNKRRERRCCTSIFK